MPTADHRQHVTNPRQDSIPARNSTFFPTLVISRQIKVKGYKHPENERHQYIVASLDDT